jgi:tetratricopeptide (TPR) repeat protein
MLGAFRSVVPRLMIGASVKTRPKEENQALVAHYTSLIEEDPADGTSYARRAWAHAQLKNWDHAIADWSRAAELEPERPGPRANRIMAYRKAGQLKTALYEGYDLRRPRPSLFQPGQSLAKDGSLKGGSS